MKMIQKYKKTLLMSAAALGLLAGLTIDSSLAYFTTYVAAGGSQTVNLEAKTEIYENVEGMTKQIVLKNTSDKGDCFVRARIFHGAGITVQITDVEGKGDWYDGGDGYWYYRPILPMGQKTSRLDAFINTTGIEKPGIDPGDGDAAAGYIKDRFNVIVVQECTPVCYRENGDAYADWETSYSEYTEVTDNLQKEGGDNQ